VGAIDFPTNFVASSLQYSTGNNVDYSSRFVGSPDKVISIDTNGQNVQFASNLQAYQFTKLGAGTLTLSGSNNSNIHILKSGTLALGSSGAMGGASYISMEGATLQYSTANQVDYSSRFVGNAGQLLDNMLRAMGLDRHGTGSQGVYITNVLKCRPPANRNPDKDEVLQCEPYLRRQVALLQPQIILALGRFAAQSVLGATVPDIASIPLGKLRGQVHHYQGVPVIVSYHPAYLLRSLGEKAKAWADLCLAMDEMDKQASAVTRG
jgi:DNA polymerase